MNNYDYLRCRLCCRRYETRIQRLKAVIAFMCLAATVAAFVWAGM